MFTLIKAPIEDYTDAQVDMFTQMKALTEDYTDAQVDIIYVHTE